MILYFLMEYVASSYDFNYTSTIIPQKSFSYTKTGFNIHPALVSSTNEIVESQYNDIELLEA